MSNDYEQRLMPGTSLEVRADEEGNENRIVGYAAVFNSMSENLGGFREMIAPGAFAGSLGEGSDIRALWNHNSDFVIGRTTAGTLRLQEDGTGLRFEVDMPESARQQIESIRRGDVNQMSFGFSVKPNGDRVEEDEDGMLIRTLTDVRLMEVSPVAFPAYQATSVDQRTVEQWRKQLQSNEPSEQTKRRIERKRALLDRLAPLD